MLDPQRQLLAQARGQAARRLAALIRQQHDLDRASALPADELAAGRAALARAVESARNVLHNLDAALAATPSDSQQEQDDAGQPDPERPGPERASAGD